MSELSLAVIVIAQNEEENIEQCLSSVVGWAKQIFVVDAFSTDTTVDLARAYGASVYQHEFKDWASQRNWALEHLPLASEWVLFLDADECVGPSFKAALEAKLNSSEAARLAGIYVRFTYYFMGKALRYAYEAPPVMRLVCPGRARWVGAGAREYCVLDGPTNIIQERITHRDLKELSYWIEKHNRNATREAIEILERKRSPPQKSSGQEMERAWRVWLRYSVYHRLPSIVRPILYFVYRYFFRLGILDGKQGLAFCFLHGLWYPFLVDLRADEMQQINMAHTPKL